MGPTRRARATGQEYPGPDDDDQWTIDGEDEWARRPGGMIRAIAILLVLALVASAVSGLVVLFVVGG